MPTAIATAYTFSSHASYRLKQRGATEADVLDAIRDPDMSLSDFRPNVRVAVKGTLRVVYDTDNSEVITVARTDQEKRQPVSGWINLTAKQAEVLLEKWGFVCKTQKGAVALWQHPLDSKNQLIPFAVPEKSTRANGKGSYRQAAQAVGVSVNEFLRGPQEGWQERMEILVQTDRGIEIMSGPDPLGINQKIGRDLVMDAADKAEDLFFGSKPEPQRMSRRAAEVLEVIHDEPLTVSEVATLLEWSHTTTKDALRELFDIGRAVRRLSFQGEIPGSTGRPSYLYLAGGPDTVIPERVFRRTTAFNPTTPTEEPQEAPVFPAPSIFDPSQRTPTGGAFAQPVATVPEQKLFTATGTTWPAGGILIQDEDGAYYVARRLVEEGR